MNDATETTEAPAGLAVDLRDKRWGSELEASPQVRWSERRSPSPKKRSFLGRIFGAVTFVATIVVVIVAAVAVQIGFLGAVTHDIRQQHLGKEFTVAAATIPPGGALAILQIPAIGLNEVVVEGDAPSQLRAGPGHHRGTAAPGKPGVSVIVGHRSRNGGPFRRLEKLKAGDRLVVKARDAQTGIALAVTAVRRTTDFPPFVASSDAELTLVTAADGLTEGRYLVVEAKSATTKEASPNKPGTAAAVRSLRPTRTNGNPLIAAWFALVVAVIAIARRMRGRFDALVVLAVGAPIAVLALQQLVTSLDALISFPS